MPPEVFLSLAMRGTFFLLLFGCLIYTIFLGYHWFTYGINTHTATTAMIVYLSGVILSFLFMGSLLLV